MNTEKFLAKVAQAFIDEKENFNEIKIVLPNRRAGLFLQQRIADIAKQPLFLPKIITIEECFHQLSGLTKIEKVEQLFRLYESHQFIAKEQADELDQFLTWAPTFLSDCSEIDTNLIEVEEFFHTLYHDRKIRNWNVADEETEMQKNYLEFWRTAKQLYEHFTKSLLNDGRAYNGLAYRYAIENIDTAYKNISAKQLWLVGFNALNRAEEALFTYVYENNLGRFFWDTDQYYVNDTFNKAGQYFREYKTTWPNDEQLKSSPKSIGKHTKSIEIIEAANDVSQCNVAAKLVAQLAEQDTVNANTAIILADELLLEPLLYQLPKELGPYNITMGKPISQFPLIHLFDSYFDLQSHLVNGSKGLAFSTSLLKPLLISPYLKLIDEQQQTTELLQYIVERNMAILWESEWNNLVDETVAWKQILRPTQSIAEQIKALHQLIELLRNQFQQQNDRLSIQVLFEIKKIIQQFESYNSSFTGEFTTSAFRNLFKQVARSTKIPYEGEPLEGIQIMGVLETRCLDFENVILLSTNENVLPKGQSGNSFIPFIFKQHYHIQTFKDKDAIYAYSFYRLLHQAKRIYFVYNGQPGALGGGEVSRFVQQIEAEFPLKVEHAVPIKHQSVRFPEYNVQEYDYAIAKTPEVQKEIISYLETQGLSPSSLKQLITSPLDFYFAKIAGIQEPKELEQDIEASTLGTIVHDSLEQLYKNTIGEELTEELLQNLLSKADKVVQQQIELIFKQGDTSVGMNYLSAKAAKTMVSQTILTDIRRIQQHSIRIYSLEEQLSCTLPVNVNGKTIQVKLKGKADRIQHRDNVIEIIDYKTGKVEPMKADKIDTIHEDPKQEKLHQILCYALMATEGEPKFELATIRPAMQPLKSWQNGLVFINDDEQFEITPEFLAAYKHQLQLVIQNLVNTSVDFAPEEDEKRIEYSAYKGIYL